MDHVRAGGPLPTLRAGKQPYGILPVTALDLWGATPEDGKLASRDAAVVAFGAASAGLLERSRAAPRRAWAITRIPTSTSRKCSPWTGCPRATPSGTSSDSSTPRNSSSSCALRRNDEWNRVQRAQAIQALALIAGLRGVTPRAALTLCDPARSGLSLPLVQSSSSADFTFNYIDQLLKAPNLDALLQHASIPAPFSLMYLLLRHSMMVEYANAAARALGRAPHLRAEPEHVRFTPAADGNAARSHYGGSTAHRTGVHATGRQERAGFPQESRGAEGVEDRQAVHVDARRSRSVVASPGRLGHIVCNEALEDHAAERSCWRVSGRLRLGRRPATWAATNGGHAAACRTGTRFRISERSRLCPCAVARSCRDGGGAAKRASHSFWPHARSTGRSACDRSVLRSRPHGAISAGWCAIRPAARRLARVSLRARPARAWAGRLHRCVPPDRADQISARRRDRASGRVCVSDPCGGWARPRAPNEGAGGSRDSFPARERVSESSGAVHHERGVGCTGQ